MELCQQFVDLCSKNNITLPETEFYWVGNELLSSSNEDDALKLSYVEGLDNVKSKPIPAPLVSELGEWLSSGIEQTWKRSGNKNWVVLFSPVTGDGTYQPVEQEANTEANARQKMLNYLIAEGIITTL